MNLQELLSFYPSLDEVEAYWRRALLEVPESVEPEETIDRTQQVYPSACDYHIGGGVWLKFRGLDGRPFWCLWQKCPRLGVHKALIHLPGYGTEVSAHPSLVHGGYHVLHVNPRGYCGPEGFGNKEWREPDGMAKVIYSLYERLPNTRAIIEFHGQVHGYTPNFLVLAKTWFDLYL